MSDFNLFDAISKSRRLRGAGCSHFMKFSCLSCGWVCGVLIVFAAVLIPVADVWSQSEDAVVDDDGSVHEPALNALAAEGYLSGTECDDDSICPGRGLQRWELAVWLGRALAGREPDPIIGSRFDDVNPKQWWAPHVERFAELNVTVGCKTDPLSYCPYNSVTRAQMASFLTRAYKLPKASPAGFTDIASNSHVDNINALAAARVTTGCETNPLRYCPRKSVTRAQMATFIARASGLIAKPSAPTAETPVPPGSVIREGSGQDVTSAVVLVEGRWRVSVSLEGSDESYFSVRASDAGGDSDSVASEIASSGSWTSVLDVGDGILELDPGEIWFEVRADQSAEWRIQVTPLRSDVVTEPKWPHTFEGSGQDVTSAVVLVEGRWRVSMSLEGSDESYFSVRASDAGGDSDSVASEIASSGSWTSVLDVGDGILELDPGEIWFEVKADPSAEWQIEIKPI